MSVTHAIERTTAGTAGRTVLVTGGRDFTDRAMLYAALDAFHALDPIGCIIEGGANGADALARAWALARGVFCMTVRANWTDLGASAGPRRNQKMVDMKPALVVAFPGGDGTDDCCRRAERARIPVSHVVCLG